MKEATSGMVESRRPFNAKEMEQANQASDRLARRIKELMKKDDLTTAEALEWELIVRNAEVISKILDGEIPEELAGLEK